MYLPVTYSTPKATAGLGYFSQIDPQLEESEFYPPPYNTDAPVDLSDIYGVAAAGLGGYRGMGLFDSLDFTTWGWGEWVALAAGAYFGTKLIGDIGKGARTVRKRVARRSLARAKRQRLKEELASL